MIIIQVDLAEICAKSERYIGTEGGGMDQSISFLAENGTVRSFLLHFILIFLLVGANQGGLCEMSIQYSLF